jgi:opacity protein-like surface antigen
MKHSIAVLLLGTALTGNLLADEFAQSERIIGLEVGASTIQADTGGYLGESDHDGSSAEFGFRLGAQLDTWRVMLILDYFDSSDDDQNYEKGLVSVDYFFPREEEGVKPYIGLNTGYLNYESTDIDESGFLYGGQLGATYRVKENIDLDVMYRYSLTEADQTDHIQSLVFGLNYIY